MPKQTKKNTTNVKKKKPVIKKVDLQKELNNILNPTYTNIYYVGEIGEIGGIETFLYELAKKYHDTDLTIFYREANKEQLKRLQKYVRTIPYTGQKIKCKRAFFNLNTSIINNIKADEYIRIVHADAKGLKLKPIVESKITQHYAVSEAAAKHYSEATGVNCKTCYNPITIEEPKRVLFLISATRASRFKGEERMKQLVNALDEAHIPFIWMIFSNQKGHIHNPNVIYMPTTLNIRDYMIKADYTVQLSDTEGYCYTVLESLSLGVPVIVTPIESIKEMGANNTNSIMVDFDMKNIPVQDIYNKHLEFSFTPKKDAWNTLLYNSPSTYQDNLKYDYIVEATDAYEKFHVQDALSHKIPAKGEQWTVDVNRLRTLLADNKFHTPFIIYKGRKLKPEYIKKEEDTKNETNTSKNN